MTLTPSGHYINPDGSFYFPKDHREIALENAASNLYNWLFSSPDPTPSQDLSTIKSPPPSEHPSSSEPSEDGIDEEDLHNQKTLIRNYFLVIEDLISCLPQDLSSWEHILPGSIKDSLDAVYKYRQKLELILEHKEVYEVEDLSKKQMQFVTIIKSVLDYVGKGKFERDRERSKLYPKDLAVYNVINNGEKEKSREKSAADGDVNWGKFG